VIHVNGNGNIPLTDKNLNPSYLVTGTSGVLAIIPVVTVTVAVTAYI